MNNERRNELNDVVDSIDEAIDRLAEISSDELEAFENLPEGLQYSARGDKMQAYADEMDSIVQDLENAKERIKTIINPRKSSKKTLNL